MSEPNFLACSVNQIPCPLEYQTLVSFADLISHAVSSIDPSEIAIAYAFGATSVVTWWGLGFCIAAAINAIRKA